MRIMSGLGWYGSKLLCAIFGIVFFTCYYAYSVREHSHEGCRTPGNVRPPTIYRWRMSLCNVIHSAATTPAKTLNLLRIQEPESQHHDTCLTRMPAEAPTIKQLPESVAIRLRSTLAVTTLSGAISELVQNSLDAGARNIRVQANLLRNSCVVEDDGVGISPVDVSMVGKMYGVSCSSAPPPLREIVGLISVATSKYPPPPNSNHTTFGFRGQALSSLATHSLFTLTSRHHEHRSTHTVRISYSTPVFTGLAPEHLRLTSAGTVVRIEGLWGDMPVRFKARLQEGVEREWEDINRTIVQLLLTPQGKGVGAIVRDDNGNRRLTVKDGNLGSWEISVLRQVYGREVIGSGWERVRAQQGGVGIEGWICTKGSATRGLQFIYINNHPLPPATTLLHAEVNRVLAASSFGVVEDEENKKSRKGVEKYGMFILRIECASGDISVLGGEGGTEGKSGLEGDHLKSVVNLLNKLLREFLKTHHFRPFSMSTRKDAEGTETDEPIQRGTVEAKSRSNTPLSTIKGNSGSFMTESVHGDPRALAMWSRVKSAKVDPKEEDGRQEMGLKAKELTFSAPIFSSTATVTPGFGGNEPKTRDELGESGGQNVIWTNPISRKSFQVNTKTGNTAPTRGNSVRPSYTRRKRPVSTLSFRSGKPSDNAKRIRRDESVDIASKGTFVEELLKNWKNPVFKPTEAPIPSLTTGAQLSTGDSCIHDCTDGFMEATSTTLGKFTKHGLRNAKVITQVDKKYILIKMQGITTNNAENAEEPELLVIVDQHAADERVRVESLFAEICKVSDPPVEELHAPKTLQKILVFKVTKREWELMHRYESVFKEWDINYRLSSKDEELSLHIYSLPAVISERCANEPNLAVDIIRKHVYELSERRGTSHTHSHSSGDWVKRIGSCPRGLVDMVNSKACRSAIMFNDPLELEECRVLMGKLASCRFPFQCAHGRPSMIPLVDLRVPSTPGFIEKGRGGFKKDFEKWMRKKEVEDEG